MDDEARIRFGEFARARTVALIRVAYLLTGDQHAAEDLVQSALAKTFARWRSIRHEDPEGYVRAVLYREQVSWWRLRRSRETVVGTPVDRACPDGSEGVELRVAMRAALLRLPPAHRAVLVLRYYEDLTESQVAEVLGCSIGTVRSRTHRAVTRLRELLPAADVALELEP